MIVSNLSKFCNGNHIIIALTFHPFHFLLPVHGKESIVFEPNFRNGGLMNGHVLRTLESENHIFSDCSLCVCASVIIIIQKQIAAETSNLIFNICIMCRCYLKLFIKTGRKLCVQGHTKGF